MDQVGAPIRRIRLNVEPRGTFTVCCVRLDLLDGQIRVVRLKIVEPFFGNEVSYDPVQCLLVVIEIYEMIIGNDVRAA
jgi:hypothetical protein